MVFEIYFRNVKTYIRIKKIVFKKTHETQIQEPVFSSLVSSMLSLSTCPPHFSFLQLRELKGLVQGCAVSMLFKSFLKDKHKGSHRKSSHKECLAPFTTTTKNLIGFCSTGIDSTNHYNNPMSLINIMTMLHVETELQRRQVTCPRVVKLNSNSDGLAGGEGNS